MTATRSQVRLPDHLARACGTSLVWFVTALITGAAAVPARAATIDWVRVGDAGNPNDTINSGTNPNYGAVAYDYRIMKHEFKNSQYVDFLNAVDPQGTNPNVIYSRYMYFYITNTGTTNGSR